MDKNEVVKGVVSLNPKGFGFAVSPLSGRFFIRPSLARYLLSGDTLTFRGRAGKNPNQYDVAEIISVERKSRIILGECFKDRHGILRLSADEPCFLRLEVNGIDVVEQDHVVAVKLPEQFLDTGASNTLDEPVLVEHVATLGPRDRDGFEYDYTQYKFGLSTGSDEMARQEAKELNEEILACRTKGWTDFRDIPFVTIDGESTTDIDDAVHVTIKSPSIFAVDVAIADVSAYVKPGSALEAQAKTRLTSVYLPGKTIHMLPESLSSDLGSLKPGVPRLALLCQMDVDREGRILGSRFRRGIIISRERLSYVDVHRRMVSGEPLSTDALVAKSIDAMQLLYKALSESRKARGVLEFNGLEAKIFVSENGEPDIEFEPRTEAHKLIEEMMLLANKAAAEKLCQKGSLALFRHQNEPRAEDWNELKTALAAKGILLADKPSLKNISEVINSVPEGEGRRFVEMATRKALQRAVYDTQEPDHFSLGYPAYTHFTSPLRRYSDILVHRLLIGEELSAQELSCAAEACSVRANQAKNAERYLWDRLKKRTIVKKIAKDTELSGHVFSGTRDCLKVILDTWDLMVLIPEISLERVGYRWNVNTKVWEHTEVLQEGKQVTVKALRLQEDKDICTVFAEIC